MTSTLRTLLDRVEKGEGADVALNWDVADAFGMVPAHRIVETGFDYDWYRRAGEHALWKANDSEGRDVSLWQPANVTSSIDASRALVLAAIPGTLVASGSMEHGPFCSMVVPREDGTYIGGGMRAVAKSEPRAIVAALLRAKIAQEERA